MYLSHAAQFPVKMALRLLIVVVVEHNEKRAREKRENGGGGREREYSVPNTQVRRHVISHDQTKKCGNVYVLLKVVHEAFALTLQSQRK